MSYLDKLIRERIGRLGGELNFGRQVTFPSHLEPPEPDPSGLAGKRRYEVFEEARQRMVEEIMELTGRNRKEANKMLYGAEMDAYGHLAERRRYR